MGANANTPFVVVQMQTKTYFYRMQLFTGVTFISCNLLQETQYFASDDRLISNHIVIAGAALIHTVTIYIYIYIYIKHTYILRSRHRAHILRKCTWNRHYFIRATLKYGVKRWLTEKKCCECGDACGTSSNKAICDFIYKFLCASMFLCVNFSFASSFIASFDKLNANRESRVRSHND